SDGLARDDEEKRVKCRTKEKQDMRQKNTKKMMNSVLFAGFLTLALLAMVSAYFDDFCREYGPYYTYQMLLDSQDPVLLKNWSPVLEIRERAIRAWAVAESICVTLGIGIYPSESKPRTVVGPTDLEKYRELKGRSDIPYNSEAVVNLDIPEVLELVVLLAAIGDFAHIC
ncbi:hypothetical protein TELCIR_15565, partial [Teladorsagia circumcincta]